MEPVVLLKVLDFFHGMKSQTPMDQFSQIGPVIYYPIQSSLPS